MRDSIVQYEVMETEMKSLEKELRALNQEKDRMANQFKNDLMTKQEEIDILKEKLLQKEGIE